MAKYTYEEWYADPAHGIIRSAEDASIGGRHNGRDCVIVADRKWGEFTPLSPDVQVTRLIGFTNTSGNYNSGSMAPNVITRLYDANGIGIPYEEGFQPVGVTNSAYRAGDYVNGWGKTTSSFIEVVRLTDGTLGVISHYGFTFGIGAILFAKANAPVNLIDIFSMDRPKKPTPAFAVEFNNETWYHPIAPDNAEWVKGWSGLKAIGFVPLIVLLRFNSSSSTSFNANDYWFALLKNDDTTQLSYVDAIGFPRAAATQSGYQSLQWSEEFDYEILDIYKDAEGTNSAGLSMSNFYMANGNPHMYIRNYEATPTGLVSYRLAIMKRS